MTQGRSRIDHSFFSAHLKIRWYGRKERNEKSMRRVEGLLGTFYAGQSRLKSQHTSDHLRRGMFLYEDPGTSLTQPNNGITLYDHELLYIHRDS